MRQEHDVRKYLLTRVWSSSNKRERESVKKQNEERKEAGMSRVQNDGEKYEVEYI